MERAEGLALHPSTMCFLHPWLHRHIPALATHLEMPVFITDAQTYVNIYSDLCIAHMLWALPHSPPMRSEEEAAEGGRRRRMESQSSLQFEWLQEQPCPLWKLAGAKLRLQTQKTL